MQPRVAFGVQSAVHKPQTLQQLVDVVEGRPVVVHHDFTQQPDFKLTGPNVHFVPDPAKTGWADWGLVAGIQKTIDYCLEHVEFDYLQLMSPVDLPIRPIAEFEAFLAKGQEQFHCDAVSLDADEMAFLSFAYRAYAVERSPTYRLLWRLWLAYFGKHPETELRAGLAIPVAGRCGRDGRLSIAARSAALASHWIVDRLRRHDPMLTRFPAHVGGMWFGATRRGCEYLSRELQNPDLLRRFRQYFCASEMLFNTAVVLSGLPYAPGNHVVSQYVGARPQWLGLDDLDDLEKSGKYFARKFPDDPHAPVRLRLLERIGAKVPGVRGLDTPGGPPAPPAAEPGDAVPSGAGAMFEANVSAALAERNSVLPATAGTSPTAGTAMNLPNVVVVR
jgi:hypothetical protein